MVCSAQLLNPTPGCNVALADKPSRIGMYALNFQPSGANTTTAYPSTYGDTLAVRGARSGRDPLDKVYRSNIVALDAEANTVINGNAGRPPGCATVSSQTCTANGRKWLVLNQSDCNSYTSFFTPLLPDLDFLTGRLLASNIWFDCDLTINNVVPLLLAGPDAYVVVTGRLARDQHHLDRRSPHGVRRRGRQRQRQGPRDRQRRQLQPQQPGAGAWTASCGPLLAKTTRLVVGNGSFYMGSGGVVHMCQTFALLASGYGKVPATDGTVPCSNPCSTYTGQVKVGSGAAVDWISPNQIIDLRPTAEQILSTHPYEDLGLWTEAGGAQSINGGGSGHMTGVFFLGNADAFTLTGNAGANVVLSAQFISRTHEGGGRGHHQPGPRPVRLGAGGDLQDGAGPMRAERHVHGPYGPYPGARTAVDNGEETARKDPQ